ncbi:MAG: response regulator transcription factor [Croceibacterium sp.]
MLHDRLPTQEDEFDGSTGGETLRGYAAATPSITRVLIVDPDAGLRAEMARFLEQFGFLVMEAPGGTVAVEILASQGADIVIMDVLMPGEDGLSLARALSLRPELAIIIVSGLGGEVDRIVGLEAGADDYLAKPVSLRELLARIRAVRRRIRSHEAAAAPAEQQQGGATFTFDGWMLDAERRSLADPRGAPVELSDGEYALLLAFLERPQRVLSRDQLLEFARGPNSEAYDRAIDTQVSRLRRKLRTRAGGELVRTVRNEGYMFLPKVALR